MESRADGVQGCGVHGGSGDVGSLGGFRGFDGV